MVPPIRVAKLLQAELVNARYVNHLAGLKASGAPFWDERSLAVHLASVAGGAGPCVGAPVQPCPAAPDARRGQCHLVPENAGRPVAGRVGGETLIMVSDRMNAAERLSFEGARDARSAADHAGKGQDVGFMPSWVEAEANEWAQAWEEAVP